MQASFYLVNTTTHKMMPVPAVYMDGIDLDDDGGVAHIYMIEPKYGLAGLTIVLPKGGLPYMTVEGHKAPDGHFYMAKTPTRGGHLLIQVL